MSDLPYLTKQRWACLHALRRQPRLLDRGDGGDDGRWLCRCRRGIPAAHPLAERAARRGCHRQDGRAHSSPAAHLASPVHIPSAVTG